jgi:acetyl-CoA acetyltransferase
LTSTQTFPRGRTVVAGVAKNGMGEAPGRRTIDMAAQAAIDALDDAGIAVAEVDGLFAMLPDDPFCGLSMAEYLGIQPRLTDNSRLGGSSFQSYVLMAALALDCGVCNVVVITYASNQRSTAGKLITGSRRAPYEAPYRPRMPVSGYALAAARHMYQFGTTREQLASVAVAARKWAQLNPEAFVRKDLTIEDCLSSRMVSDPLSVADCCLVTDGAAAIVMVRADRACDIRRAPIHVLGAACSSSHIEVACMPDLTSTSAVVAGAEAMSQAGVAPSDIDVVELYDAFTINTILFLEDLGFCKKGEGGSFVSNGRIAPGGELPVNTNGGGLSCVHPGMYGMFTLIEAVEQLRGSAGERQIAGANLALAQGNGMVLASEAVVVLGTVSTL